MEKGIKREKLEEIRIGSLCSDCTNPTEKVMTSYVFDLKDIITLGMYEKALISAQVPVEQGGEPIEIMKNTVFPTVKEMLIKYKEKKINKIELMKSLQTGDMAAKALEELAGKEWEGSEASEWKTFLKETLRESFAIE